MRAKRTDASMMRFPEVVGKLRLGWCENFMLCCKHGAPSPRWCEIRTWCENYWEVVRKLLGGGVKTSSRTIFPEILLHAILTGIVSFRTMMGCVQGKGLQLTKWLPAALQN